MIKIQYLYFAVMFLMLAGCTSYGVIDNPPLQTTDSDNAYSWKNWFKRDDNQELGLFVSFSGGGTRAAAMAYGVLKALRDTRVMLNGESVRLLDQVDQISSVSGGSFTAAYYGLYGDDTFETFREAFLERDVEQHLFWGLANPLEWFRQGGRTEMAIRYYNETVFHDATFADIYRGGPLIIINASGLGHGIRFSFLQEYFDLICSDLNSFPVAKAVAASSSVPILFLPVVLQKYPDCGANEPHWLTAARRKAEKTQDPVLAETIAGIDILLSKESFQYLHLVDGGITDNLGLLALYDFVTLSGGAEKTLEVTGRQRPKRFVIISVNSSTEPELNMDRSHAEPSISETISAMSGAQLHRYNSSTQKLIAASLKQWAEEISTPENPVKSYFINLGLRDITTPEKRVFFNKIPTSFGLSAEVIDKLVNGGEELLLNDREFQRLISDIGVSHDVKINPVK